jgi:RNA polymerase sigma-70 factor, ECF subfamily
VTEKKPSFRDAMLAAMPNLRAFAISLCGDSHTANDLVQETLLKAWVNQTKFESGTNMKAWLFTILRNTYFSEFRKTRREVQDTDDLHAAKLWTPANQISYLEVADMQRALMQLTADQREALLLVGAEGLSYDEAATIAGCAVGTIKSRVNRARTRLAELISGDALALPLSARNDDAGQPEPK